MLLAGVVGCQSRAGVQERPAGKLVVDPALLNFGVVASGAPAELSLTITNPGRAAFRLAEVQSDCECVSVSPTSLSIEAGGRGVLSVRFRPEVADTFHGALRVELTGLDDAGEVAFSATVDARVE